MREIKLPYRGPLLPLITLLLGAAALAAGGLAQGAASGWHSAAAQAAASQAVAYVDVWGPAVGSSLPMLEAPDQEGRMRTLEDLTGNRGLLLFLIRSADW